MTINCHIQTLDKKYHFFNREDRTPLYKILEVRDNNKIVLSQCNSFLKHILDLHCMLSVYYQCANRSSHDHLSLLFAVSMQPLTHKIRIKLGYQLSQYHRLLFFQSLFFFLFYLSFPIKD